MGTPLPQKSRSNYGGNGINKGTVFFQCFHYYSGSSLSRTGFLVNHIIQSALFCLAPAVSKRQFEQEKVRPANIFRIPSADTFPFEAETFIKPMRRSITGKSVQPYRLFALLSAELNDMLHYFSCDSLFLKLRVNTKDMHHRNLAILKANRPEGIVIILALEGCNRHSGNYLSLFFAEIHSPRSYISQYHIVGRVLTVFPFCVSIHILRIQYYVAVKSYKLVKILA